MLLQIVYRKIDPVRQVIDDRLQVTCPAGKTSSEVRRWLPWLLLSSRACRHNSGTESTVLTLIHFWWRKPDQFENPLCRRGIIHLTTHWPDQQILRLQEDNTRSAESYFYYLFSALSITKTENPSSSVIRSGLHRVWRFNKPKHNLVLLFAF